MMHNSPNFPHYLTPPIKQCFDPAVEELMRQVIREENPAVIHFHELQMHTASLIDVAAAAGIPAVKMMHNYYDLCPQRDLMYKGEERCFDFREGEKCNGCLHAFIERRVFTKIFKHHLYSIFVAPLPKWLFKPLSYVYHKIKSDAPEKFRSREEMAALMAAQYLDRRKFFVERLNKLAVVQCSSVRSAEIFAGYGVKKEKINIIYPSSKLADMIKKKPLRDDSLPVVFGYIGGSQPAKGFNVLLGAFALLDQTRAKLIIWSTEKNIAIPKGLNIEIRGHYKTEEVEKVFNEIDVGVVPSIWDEAFGLIGIEWRKAGIPVIGSRIGAIPEWLSDGESGYLVKAGSILELSEKMDIFVKNPGNIRKMQEKMKLCRAHG